MPAGTQGERKTQRQKKKMPLGFFLKVAKWSNKNCKQKER